MCGKYCSKKCLDSHENHSQYCSAICVLEDIEYQKRKKRDISVSDSEKLPLNMKLTLIKLVGERPLVRISLNGKTVECLWDTGSMISLVSKQFLEDQFPRVTINPVEEFMEKESLTLTAANNSEVLIEGVAVLNFGVTQQIDLFQVPFLVTSENISRPIMGYNII